MYFKSQTAEYIFYLVEMDGKQRADKLNITYSLYSSKKRSKKWYDEILAIIKAEDHPMQERAIDKLNQIYSEMTRC